ncbi:MAG: hypothetical protein DCC55_14310 [Chloroflexi bacterium]|nr:MAG: hypothetical protein DCC55_14310 [Chloroflexota bacterium]
MLKPRIFISHSAKDPFAETARDQLFTALAEAGFDPFLDKRRLQPGARWSNELHTWLGLCHGAVILFSADALASDWVLKETTILTYRQTLDEKFPILPVLLPGVQVADLQKPPFAALDVTATQAFKVEAPGDATASDLVTRCVELLSPLLPQLTSESPLQKIERILASGLNNIGRNNLEQVAGALNIELPPWQPDESYTQAFVRALFHQEIGVIEQVMAQLVPYPVINRDFLSRMLDILLTVYAIDPSLVTPIPAVVRCPQYERRNVAVNARFMSTGEMFIQRACWFDARWTVWRAHNRGGTDAAGNLLSELRAWGARLYNLDEDEFASADEFYDYLDAKIASLTRDSPTIVLVPDKIRNLGLVPAIRSRYEGLTFFLLRPKEAIDEQVLKSAYIVFLEPFQPELEEQWVNLRGAARKSIEPPKPS